MALELVRIGRQIRQEYISDNKKKAAFFIRTEPTYIASLEPWASEMETLLTASQVSILDLSGTVPDGCTMQTTGEHQVHVMVKGLIDVAKEVKKLEKKAKALRKEIAGLDEDIASPNFSKAPEDVQQRSRDKLTVKKTELEEVERAIENVKS